MLDNHHCKVLTSRVYITDGFKVNFPKYSYMHGLTMTLETAEAVWGPNEWSDSLKEVYADVKEDRYHALIIDNEIRDKIARGEMGECPPTLRDLLTGKDNRAIVERLNSDNPEEITVFIHKWLDPNFTFYDTSSKISTSKTSPQEEKSQEENS